MASRHPGVSINTITRLDGSPCTSTACSRFEVYLWEIGGLTPGATSPDRRIVTLPVVDSCATTTPTPTTWIEVFLTEQVGPSTGHSSGHVANELYVELIGIAGRFGQGVMRHVVRLVE
jgi:hypothetical protein